MPNQQVNATFLDALSEEFTASSGTLSVDETIYGATGRAVLAVHSPGVFTSLYLGPRLGGIVIGSQIEVSVYVGGAPDINVVVNTGGFVPGFDNLPIPLVRRGDGAPRRGIPSTFNLYRGKVSALKAGSTVINITGTPGSDLVVMKPFIDTVATGRDLQCWQPGHHDNPDLDLPSWPTFLPDFVPDSLQFQGIPTRKGFEGDSGVESTRKRTNTQRFKMRGELRLSMEERDVLDQFFLSTNGPFWITRPDTQQVCQASWLADGEPSDAGLLAGARRTQIGLLLKVL